ncbi:MAG: methylenetetrahydrofolate reductase [Spirochaetes bacterium]|nr:MAG: methylenetetrahydrofolate reductase [Spirochaetota bacterium]
MKNSKAGSRLEKLLDRGEFVVTAELGPPKSVDREVIDSKVEALRDAVDAVNITDNQTAIVRVSSISTGIYVAEKGLEPIFQVTCRDRNRLAIQADLLGACLNGLKNVLCLTGDHQSFGNHPQAKQVYDIDSIQLIKMVKDMRDEKIFQCGEEIRNSKKAEIREPRFLIGAAANPFADPLEWRVNRLEKKVNAGVDFIQTQCIYDMERFEQWMEEVVSRGLHEKVKILAGVTPIRSLGMLRYMRDSVAGVRIPDSVIKRFEDAENAREEGINFCVEQIKRFRKMKGVAGVHIMAIEWENAVRGIVESADLLPRPNGV